MSMRLVKKIMVSIKSLPPGRPVPLGPHGSSQRLCGTWECPLLLVCRRRRGIKANPLFPTVLSSPPAAYMRQPEGLPVYFRIVTRVGNQFLEPIYSVNYIPAEKCSYRSIKKGNMYKEKTLIEKGVPGTSTSCPDQLSRQFLTTASTFTCSSKNSSDEHIHAFFIMLVPMFVSLGVSE